MSLFSNVPGAVKILLPLAAGGALAGAISFSARGGGSGTTTPPPLASAPTARPEKTPDLEATLTRLRQPPIAAATPVKTLLGPRTDCPAGWAFYNDPDGHFSFCYPPGLRTTTGAGVPGGSQAVTVDTPPISSTQPGKGIVFTIYWEPISPFQTKLLKTRCQDNQNAFGIDVIEEPLTLHGHQVVACLGVGSSADHGVDPLSIEMEDPVDGGWIQIFAFQVGSDIATKKGIIGQMLDSLRIHGEP